MSSSEQAPEPTMDEILASIRKIIADDDESSASAPEASPDVAAHQTAHGTLTDEIADAMGQEDASGEAEDDIFDLTDKVHEPAPQPSPAGFAPPPPPVEPSQPQYGLPPQPQEPEPAAFSAPPEAHPIPPVTSEAPLPPEPSFADERPGEPLGIQSAAGGVLAGAPMEESALPESASGFGAAEAGPPVEDASWETPDDAHQVDSPSATEYQQPGEIADLDSFSPGQNIAPAGDRVEEAFAESDVVAATGVPQPAAFDEPAAPPANEFSAAPELEEPAPAPVAEAPDPVIVPPAPEPSLAEEAEAPEAAEAEEDAPVAADASRKSLEDSVKEMLRPMLREWLDDNMPRIVESAVRDELQNKHNQF